MSGIKKKGSSVLIQNRRVSLYLPTLYLRRAEEMGNLSVYFRRASDALEMHEESIFFADYKYLMKKLHRSLIDMSKYYNAGKLSKEEEKFFEAQQEVFLLLRRHPWKDDINEL